MEEFDRWAGAAGVAVTRDFSELGEMIGDASVVALGEPGHGAAQPLEFRNRLLKYLVASRGFTAIAIESGVAEGRIVQGYVRGAVDELDSVMARGFTWEFGRFAQNRQLVEWLRECGVSFYGFDVPGSLGMVELRSALRAEELRDRAQADNIEAIVGREGKVLVFAHRFHLCMVPVKRSFPDHGVVTEHQPAGIFLKQRFGGRLVTVGLGAGELRFALDLRRTPEGLCHLLRHEQQGAFGRQCFAIELTKAFDVLVT